MDYGGLDSPVEVKKKKKKKPASDAGADTRRRRPEQPSVMDVGEEPVRLKKKKKKKKSTADTKSGSSSPTASKAPKRKAKRESRVSPPLPPLDEPLSPVAEVPEAAASPGPLAKSGKKASTPKSRRRSSVSAESVRLKDNVRVCIRFRPLNKREKEMGGTSCVTISDGKKLEVEWSKEKQTFTFDAAFGAESTQAEIYEYAARPLVEEALNGYNCTMFAYGQTGSGKTHTMMGQPQGDPNGNPCCGPGIIPRIVDDLFTAMHAHQSRSRGGTGTPAPRCTEPASRASSRPPPA